MRDLKAKNICTKVRTSNDGKTRGGVPFGRGSLTQLAKLRGELVEAGAVQVEWSNILRVVRAGMLAPSRVAARLPHLSKHDVAEIDSEIRAALAEIGGAPS